MTTDFLGRAEFFDFVMGSVDNLSKKQLRYALLYLDADYSGKIDEQGP
jgi:hypothetical protein